MKYKGYTIQPNLLRKHHSNRISGHKWTEYVDGKRFNVIGDHIPSVQQFYTIKAAKLQIDFVVRFKAYYFC